MSRCVDAIGGSVACCVRCQGCLGTWVGGVGAGYPLPKTEPPLFVPTQESHCVSKTSLFLDGILYGASPCSAPGDGTVPRGLSPRPGSSCLTAGEPRPGHRATAGRRYEDEEGPWPAQENMDPVRMIGPPAFISSLCTPGPVNEIVLLSVKRPRILQAKLKHSYPSLPACGRSLASNPRALHCLARHIPV